MNISELIGKNKLSKGQHGPSGEDTAICYREGKHKHTRTRINHPSLWIPTPGAKE